MREGLHSVGVNNHTVAVFETLMDSKSLVELALTTTRTTARMELLAELTVHMAVWPEQLGTTRLPERAGEPSVVAVFMAAQERPAHTTRTQVLTVQRGRDRTPTVSGGALL